MLDALAATGALERSPPMSAGDRRALVMQTVVADDDAKLGKLQGPMPKWLGTIVAWLLELIGPKGLEFAKRVFLDWKMGGGVGCRLAVVCVPLSPPPLLVHSNHPSSSQQPHNPCKF
jgi:hypothetical protein